MPRSGRYKKKHTVVDKNNKQCQHCLLWFARLDRHETSCSSGYHQSNTRRSAVFVHNLDSLNSGIINNNSSNANNEGNNSVFCSDVYESSPNQNPSEPIELLPNNRRQRNNISGNSIGVLESNELSASNDNEPPVEEDCLVFNNELQSPYDFSKISESMVNDQQYNVFTHQELLSLKLHEILRKAKAPLSLYTEIKDFIDVSVPLWSKLSYPYIVNKDVLIKNMHKVVFSGGLPSKVAKPKKKRKSRKRKSTTLSPEDIINEESSSTTSPSGNVDVDVTHSENTNSSPILPVVEGTGETTTTVSKTIPKDYKFSLIPILKEVSLTDIHVCAQVPCFNLVSSIVSLLNNPLVHNETNSLYNDPLYLNPSNPTLQPDAYNDIHTSLWYKETHT